MFPQRSSVGQNRSFGPTGPLRDTTPSAYLHAIRLRGARGDLLGPSNQETVKDICLKWGFFHFGRFSGAYREAYGEKPSDTKRRTART
ncbi:AraC family transcriptional regulator (plasmid) [Rhizobium sp. SL42]|nr:AraC family transcriptional regulator [Rhizobium sp. SL42]